MMLDGRGTEPVIATKIMIGRILVSLLTLVAAADRQHGASNIGSGVRREEEDGGRHFTQEAISLHMT